MADASHVLRETYPQVLLGHPDEHLVGVGAVGLQPRLELVGGREELHVHPTAFDG